MSNLWRFSNRKARKSHECIECKGEIAPGEVYEFISGVFEGRGFSVKTCRECDSIRRRALTESDCMIDECPDFGDLLRWMREGDLDDLVAEFQANQQRRSRQATTSEEETPC